MRRQLYTTQILTFFALLSIHFGALAQWSRIPNIYGGKFANYGAVSFSINGKGYVCAGSSSDNIYEYDTTTKTWSIKDQVPSGMGHSLSMAFVINSTAYIIGGDVNGFPVATVWAFDPLAKGGNYWTRKNDFPDEVRDDGVGFTLNNTGYIAGGFDGGTIFSDIWKYNEANDSWTQEPNDIPGGGLIFPSAFVLNNKAYIVGGGTAPNGTNETQQLAEFDPTTHKWTVLAPFPGSARQSAFSFSNSNFGYVGGGQSGYSAVFNDMWRYNYKTNSWTKVENSPLYSPAWSSAFAIDNNAYVGIGAKFVSGGIAGVDSFYKYKMSTTDPAGINTNSDELNWSLYPNPVKNTIHITGNINDKNRIFIYDNLGKERMGNLTAKNIDISQLPDGIYTLQVRSQNGITSRQFIKAQ